MAITLRNIQTKVKRIMKKPTLATVAIVLLTLLAEWYEHYLHPTAWESSDVRVIDGDTIVLANKRIRLQGIDAPELKQQCQTNITKVSCGQQARAELETIVSDNKVSCTDEGQDKYHRQLSYCYVNGNSINRVMVKTGYARSYRHYDLLFIFDELYALTHKNGLWADGFEEPWAWRCKSSIQGCRPEGLHI